MGWHGCCCSPSCAECLPTATTIYVTLPSCSDASGGPSCTNCNWLTTTFALTYRADQSSSTVKSYFLNSNLFDNTSGGPKGTILCCDSANPIFSGEDIPCTAYPCSEFTNVIPENPFFPSTNKCIFIGISAIVECVNGGADLKITVTCTLYYYRNGDGCYFFSQHKWTETYSSFDCPFASKTVTNYTTLYGATTFSCPSPSNIGCQFSGNATVYV